MLSNIISSIVAHKAGLLLTGAAAGVVVTAIMATKDKEKYSENVLDSITDEMIEMIENDMDDEETEEELYKRITPKKEKAIIFAKSYWRTGLSMAVTWGLMILSHHSMAKELAATAAALGVVSTKYKELDKELKEKFPDVHKKVHDILDEKNFRKENSKKHFRKEETYDGRNKYYEPITEQICFLKETDVKEAENYINKLLVNDNLVTLADYIGFLEEKDKRNISVEPWMYKLGWYRYDEEFDYNVGYSEDGYWVGIHPEHMDIKDKDGDSEVVLNLRLSISPTDFDKTTLKDVLGLNSIEDLDYVG